MEKAQHGLDFFDSLSRRQTPAALHISKWIIRKTQ